MKELAAVKNGNKLTGFMLYNGKLTYFYKLDKVKELAANNDIDTLCIKNGDLVPTLSGNDLESLNKINKKIAKRMKNNMTSLSLNEYVELDAQFREKDIQATYSAYMNASGTISGILKYKNLVLINALVYATSNFVDQRIQDFVRKGLQSGKIPNQSLLLRQGNIYTLAFLVDFNNKENDGMIDLNENYGIRIFWNPNGLHNITDKMQWNFKSLGVIQRKLMQSQLPSQDDINKIQSYLNKYSL